MNKYIIRKIKNTHETIDWDNADIANINLKLKLEAPFHYNSTARLLYDNEAIYVFMESDEMPVVAKQTERNSPVCTDSCMEFFICPNIEDGRYFNFEINALGTLSLGLGSSRSNRENLGDDVFTFDIRPQLKENGWCISYKIPFSFIKKYVGEPTTQMRGNFYKCRSSIDFGHYGVWNLIETPKGGFHQPDYFGSLEFESK